MLERGNGGFTKGRVLEYLRGVRVGEKGIMVSTSCSAILRLKVPAKEEPRVGMRQPLLSGKLNPTNI